MVLMSARLDTLRLGTNSDSLHRPYVTLTGRYKLQSP